ncbi:MAG TPA: hypothetical protein ENJ00_10835 [Phycisphaerales bacterium]|nr:hypothetical protein [Phycisphaerales bacterium]
MTPTLVPDRHTMRPATFVAWLIVATALGLLLRAAFLGRPSFWIDEIFTVLHTARIGEGNLSKQFGYVPTYITLWLADALPTRAQGLTPSTWAGAGVTETLVRLPSLVIGVLTIPILGWLARPIIGARAAVIFAALLAVSTWHLHMSQTGRFYTQQLLFYNMALLLYFRATSIGSKARLAMAMASLVLAFLSQPTALMIGLVLGIDWLLGVRRRDPDRLTGWSVVLGGVAAVVCIGILFYDVFNNTNDWSKFANATSQKPVVIVAGSIWYMNPAVALVAFTGVMTLLQREARLAIFLGVAAAAPILTMAALALGDNFVHVRYTFVALPAWLMLAAVALDRSCSGKTTETPRYLSAMPAAVVIVACAYQGVGYYTGGGGYRPAWREAFQELDSKMQPDELVFGDFHARMIGAYYLHRDAVTEVNHNNLWPQLVKLDRPAWIIDKVGTAGGLNWRRLKRDADLIWYFDRQVLQPYSSIKLFRYTPEVSEAE